MMRKILFVNMCRLCGQEKQSGVNVLNGPRGNELLSKINSRLSKEIVHFYPEDGLPKFVCTDCEVIVSSFSEFCNMVRSVQQKLEVISNSCEEGSSCMNQHSIGCTPSVSISTGACITCLLCGSSLGSNTECAQLHLVSHRISSPYFVCRICGSSGEGFGSPVQVAAADGLMENENWNRCTACNSEIQTTQGNGMQVLKNVGQMQGNIQGVMQVQGDGDKGSPSHRMVREGDNRKKRKSRSSATSGKEGENLSQGIESTKNFTCEVCARTFTSRAHLSRHRLVHSGARPFRCDSCPAAFSQKGSLQVHQLQHSGSVPYPYTRCPRAFRSKGSSCMNQRNLGCTPSVSISTGACITCLLCGSSLGSNTECAQLHLVSHGISSPYFVCRICGSSGEGFGSPVQVAAADGLLENENWNRCTACNSEIQAAQGNGTEVLKNMGQMQGNIQGVMQVQGDGHKGSPSHRMVREGDNRKKRKSRSSATNGKEGENLSQGIESTKNFTCEVCARTFASRAHLSRHRLVHSGARPFRCDSCPAAFSQKGSLQVHQLQHSGSVPYPCPHCPRAFRFKVSLRSHILNIHPGESISINGMDTDPQPQLQMCDQGVGGLHTRGSISATIPPPDNTQGLEQGMPEDSVSSGRGTRPSSDHACDRCGKRFATAYKLGRHYRSHTGERPFECRDCGRCFSQTGNLNLHRKIHHSQTERQQQQRQQMQHLQRDDSDSTREDTIGGSTQRETVAGERGTDANTMSTCGEATVREAFREDRQVGIQGFVEMEGSLGFENMGVEKGVLGDGREAANDCILSVGDFEENIAQSLLGETSTNIVRHHTELTLMPSPLSCATPTISAMDKVLSGQTLSQIMEGEGLVDKVFSKLGADSSSSVVYHSEGLMVEEEGFPEMEALGGRQYNEYVENVGGGEEGGGLLFMVEEEGLSTPMPAFPSLQTPPPMPHT